MLNSVLCGYVYIIAFFCLLLFKQHIWFDLQTKTYFTHQGSQQQIIPSWIMNIGKESYSLACNYSDGCIFNMFSWLTFVYVSAVCAAELTSHDINFSGHLSLILADNPHQGHHQPRRKSWSGRPLALLSRLHSWIAENIMSECCVCAFLLSIVLVLFPLVIEKSELRCDHLHHFKGSFKWRCMLMSSAA